MSSHSQEKRADLLGELRQLHGLAESFYRAMAAQRGMTVTDMQVIDLLGNVGVVSAGQLVELTGLTGGAITGLLKRLEELGLVQRVRDPADGRRVMVQLTVGKEKRDEIGSSFASLEVGWGKIASHYNDEQMAFLLTFLRDVNTLSQQEIIRMRDAPGGERGVFSSPVLDLKSARLVISAGIARLTLRTDTTMTELYQARFEEPVPEVKVKDEVVTINYPQRWWGLFSEGCTADMLLSTVIPWQIVIQGGAAQIDARIGSLNLASLEIKGGLATMHLELPRPSSVILLRISGGAGEITLRRPEGVGVRVRLKGSAHEFRFDEQILNRVGNNTQIQSAGFVPADPHYDIEIANAAGKVTITTG